MRKLITLIRREMWEYRTTFLTLPFVVGILMCIAGVCALALFLHTGSYPPLLEIDPSIDGYNVIIQTFVYAVSLPFALILWLMVFNYFLASLFEDRKTRSILFWQSMPIPQTQVIISKLITGMIVAPLLAMVAVVICELFILLLLSVFMAHFALGTFGELWSAKVLLLAWGRLLVTFFAQAICLFPLFTWCMLCSAYSRKTPFKIAIVVPILLALFGMLWGKNNYILKFITGSFKNSFSQYFALPTLQFPKELLVSMGIGVLIGLVFVIIAGQLRRRSFHFDSV
jgi:ABC-2 type transport system permease protein